MTGMVVNVAVSVVVVAAIARTAEHRAGPSRHRAHRAADHCTDRTADRGARDGAAGRAHGLRSGGASAKRKAPQRNKGDFVHTVLLPADIDTTDKHKKATFVPQIRLRETLTSIWPPPLVDII